MTQYWILFLLFLLLQDHCYCGIAPANRIVNGKTASDGEFPYQLSLRRFSKHVCGASVLNANWAVTAAHCLIGPVREYSVRAGTHKRSTGGVVRSVKEILVHPLYEAVSMNFDVALLHMESTLRGDMITPIPLPKTRQAIPLHGSAVVSGWGHSSAVGSRLPEDLNYAEVYIIDQEKCAEMLLAHGIVTNAMFCAAEEHADACQGDSGGPITMDGLLIGIVSWGIGCADPDYPGVYTRLSHPAIRNWIKVSTRM